MKYIALFITDVMIAADMGVAFKFILAGHKITGTVHIAMACLLAFAEGYFVHSKLRVTANE